MLQSVNIQIMFQEPEQACTLLAVESVLPQLGPGRSLSLLLNGGRRPDLAALYGALPNVHYFESDTNLGVAGGRNRMLSEDVAKSADVILFIDNDAIIPIDYVDRTLAFLNAHPEAGIVGAVSLKFAPVADHRLKPLGDRQPGQMGAGSWPVTSDQIAAFIKEYGRPYLIDQMGTNPDWKRTYFDDAGAIDGLIEAMGHPSSQRFYTTLGSDPDLVAQVFAGEVDHFEVTNVAGLCQAFRRSLRDELGALDDLFNPYGFEDVEFAIRAIKAGYRNYIDARKFILHGTDRRHRERVAVERRANTVINSSRARTILEFHHAEDFGTAPARRLLQRGVVLKTIRPETVTEDLYYQAQGIRIALNQLAEVHGKDHPRLASYAAAIAGPAKLPAAPRSDGGAIKIAFTPESLSRRDRLLAERGDYRPKSESIGSYPAPGASDFARLARFRDLHKGRRGFIIGNGPSLKQTDFSYLQDEVSFGVNGIFYMSDTIGFRPMYYCVEDNHVVMDNLPRVNSYPIGTKFFPAKYAPVIAPNESTYFMPTDWSFYFKSSPFFETPQFSDDVAAKIFVGQTVTYLNLQLAYYMGLTEVYLIGVDFHYEIPKEDPVEGFTITSQADDPNHFHPDYFGKGKKWHFPKLHNCLKAYSHSRTVYEAVDRTVYNATIGGKLEAFKRRGYYDIFGVEPKSENPNTAPAFILTNAIRALRERRANEASGQPITIAFHLAGDKQAEDLKGAVATEATRASSVALDLEGGLDAEIVVRDARTANPAVISAGDILVFEESGLSGADPTTAVVATTRLKAAIEADRPLRIFNDIALPNDLVPAGIHPALSADRLANPRTVARHVSLLDALMLVEAGKLEAGLVYVDCAEHHAAIRAGTLQPGDLPLEAELRRALRKAAFPFVVMRDGLMIAFEK